MSFFVSFFAAITLAWKIFWQVVRLQITGSETITVSVGITVPRVCSLCGEPSCHSVNGADLCIPCAVVNCVAHNTRQERRLH